jgi:hypothetical protein
MLLLVVVVIAWLTLLSYSSPLLPQQQQLRLWVHDDIIC